MNPENEILKEYDHLYAEIGRNSQITQNVFVANVAVTSGLIGYGLEAGSSLIFLAPFAIMVPSLFFLASQMESTTRIAAYVTTFIERDIDALNWESRWLELRQKDLLPSKRKYALSLSGLYSLISIVCILLSFKYWPYDIGRFAAVVAPIAVLMSMGLRLLVRAFSLTLCEAYVSAWEKLR